MELAHQQSIFLPRFTFGAQVVSLQQLAAASAADSLSQRPSGHEGTELAAHIACFDPKICDGAVALVIETLHKPPAAISRGVRGSN